MRITYYTYSEQTKRLSRAKDPETINGRRVTHPTAAMYATIGAFPLAPATPPPTPPEGKVAVQDGYEVQNGQWVRKWRFEDAPAERVLAFAPNQKDLTDAVKDLWERSGGIIR